MDLKSEISLELISRHQTLRLQRACGHACVHLFVALFICAMGDDCVTVASGVMMILSLQVMKDASCVHMREKKRRKINVASGEEGVWQRVV